MEEVFSLIPTPEEYIQSLRERHILKPKMTSVLDHITLYVKDLHVYRVLLVARYDVSSRQMKKSGLTEEYTIIPVEPSERIRMEYADKELNIDKGNYLLQYNILTHDIGIYLGEPE